MQSRHQFSVGIEGNLLQTGICLTHISFIAAGFADECQQGRFRRVTHMGFTIDGTIITQSGMFHQFFQGRNRGIRAFRIPDLAHGKGFLYGHAVLSQSPCFIRADDGNRTQRFHGTEFFDDSIFLCHFLGTDGQTDGHDGGQGFGDGRHRQRHRKHQGIPQPHAAPHAQTKHDGTDHQNDDGQLLGEIIQTALQGCCFFLGGFHQMGDLTHFCIHACACDQNNGTAIGHQRAAVDHIHTVAQRQFFLCNGFVALIHVFRFPCQGGFIHLQGIVFQNTAVCRRNVPRFQEQDIPGHQFGCGNFLFFAVSDDSCVRGRHGFQAVQRFLRFEMLGCPQNGIHNQNGNDNNSTFDTAGQGGNDGRNDEDHHQKVCKLFRKHLQHRFPFPFLQFVFAVFFQPCFCFSRCQPAGVTFQQGIQLFFLFHP